MIRSLVPEHSIIRKGYSKIKSWIASVFYPLPKDVTYIGITGTDGKTSTTAFLSQMLTSLGAPNVLLSTEYIWIGDDKRENITKRTTLSPFSLLPLVQEGYKKGIRHVILEVSSHALEQGRVDSVPFEHVAITNLTPEHLNYHGDMNSYAKAKAKLFALAKKHEHASAVMPTHFEYESLFPKLPLTSTVSLEAGDFHVSHIHSNTHGIECTLHTDTERFPIHIPLIGEYNIHNVLTCIALLTHMGYEITDCIQALKTLKPVPGRLEKQKTETPYSVFIDFAVTPGALEHVLQSLDSITSGRIILVFGCTGGNHDTDKRPIMGRIAEEYADITILTEDETYGESNENIVTDILSGMEETPTIIHDRKEAIFHALAIAEEGDSVIITGMGNFQSRNNGKEIPWSDSNVIQEFFNQAS